MKNRALPSLVGTVVAVATGGGFHLTPGDLTIATLVTGLFSAGVVSFFQRGKRDASPAPDYLVNKLEVAEQKIELLQNELDTKDELIDELRRHHKQS